MVSGGSLRTRSARPSYLSEANRAAASPPSPRLSRDIRRFPIAWLARSVAGCPCPRSAADASGDPWHHLRVNRVRHAHRVLPSNQAQVAHVLDVARAPGSTLNRSSGIGTEAPAATPQSRIEQVPEGVAQHVETVHLSAPALW